MKQNNLIESNVNSIYRLDPESDRYRICPECKTPFMANHRSTDFHDRKCADDYNNRKKKLAKQAQQLLQTSNAPELINENPNVVVATPVVPAVPVVPVMPVETGELCKPKPIQNSPSTNVVSNANESKLATLLAGRQEMEIEWSIVSQYGFDFDAYDSIEKLPHCELNKANYGDFSIFWMQTNKILITNNKQQL